MDIKRRYMEEYEKRIGEVLGSDLLSQPKVDIPIASLEAHSSTHTDHDIRGRKFLKRSSERNTSSHLASDKISLADLDNVPPEIYTSPTADSNEPASSAAIQNDAVVSPAKELLNSEVEVQNIRLHTSEGPAFDVVSSRKACTKSMHAQNVQQAREPNDPNCTILIEKRIARRKKGVLSRKRRFESASYCKRPRLEDVPSFLPKYLELLKEEQNAYKGIEQTELAELKKRFEELEAFREKERREVERTQLELENLKKEREEWNERKHEAELNKIKQEAELATQKIKQEMEKLLALKEELAATTQIKVQKERQKLTVKRHQTIKITIPEPTSLRECNPPPKKSVNAFFQAAKREHIERINQTMLARSEEGANKLNGCKPQSRPSPGTADIIQPHKLYKQSIDSQSLAGTPKSYVPRCEIPFYATEEEFEAGDKRFSPAAFTKDPKLTQIVRMQSHDEIEQYFGKKQDIDVEKIFSNIDNVSNHSPNKFEKKM